MRIAKHLHSLGGGLGILCALTQFAQAGAGTEAASFLDIPVGGRPAAMGDAYSALATDAYATTSNPGGLGFVDSTQLAAEHLSYLSSIHYEYLSFVHPIHPGSTIGASAQYLGSGDITQTDTLGNSVGQFSTHYAAYSLAYGHSFGDKLSLGLTGKVIDAEIANVGARAYAADLGTLYRATSRLNLAAVLTNIGTKLTFLNDGGTLPLAFKLGAAYQPDTHCTLSIQGVYNNTGLTTAEMGAEWRPLEMIAIRAGYRTDTTKELGAMAGLSTGLGIHVWGQELSYAWVPYGDLGNTQYFSFLLHFGAPEQGKRNLIQYQTMRTDRTIKNDNADKNDPDVQQLMQLLSDQDNEFYASRPDSGGQL
jgi:hypothetical protein